MDKMLRRPGGVWRNDHALLVFLIIVLFLPRGSRPICSQSSQSKAVANNVHRQSLKINSLKTASAHPGCCVNKPSRAFIKINKFESPKAFISPFHNT